MLSLLLATALLTPAAARCAGADDGAGDGSEASWGLISQEQPRGWLDRLSMKGELRLSAGALTSEPDHPPVPTPRSWAEARLGVEARWVLGDEASIFADTEAIGSHHRPAVPSELRLIEGYLELNPTRRLRARLGRQVLAWGSGVMFNPTDTLTGWDLRDPLEPTRLGALAARCTLYVGDLSSIELIYLPEMRSSPLPPLGIGTTDQPSAQPTLTDLTGIATGPGLADVPVNMGRAWADQVAFRVATSLAGFDVVASYSDGYESIAIADLASLARAAAGEGPVDLVHPKQRVIGLDIAGYVGELGLHLETAYFDMASTGRALGMGDEDHLSSIVGLEYLFDGLIGTQGLSVSIEYARELGQDEDHLLYFNRIFRDSILARLQLDVDYRLSAELRYVAHLDHRGGYLGLIGRYRSSDSVELLVRADLPQGPAGTFYGEYEQMARVYTGAVVSF